MGFLSADGIGEEAINSKPNLVISTKLPKETELSNPDKKYVIFSHGHAWEIICFLGLMTGVMAF
jgi:hypothetical protein